MTALFLYTLVMKKLDNGDKMIIASVILAIGIAISAYFIANQKSELEKCVDLHIKNVPDYRGDRVYFCGSYID